MDRHHLSIPEGRKQRLKRGVQPEEAVEVEHAKRFASGVRARNGEAWAGGVVGGFAVRHDHVERVGPAAQKHDHQHVAARIVVRLSEGKARHPAWQRRGERRQRAGLQEIAA